MRFANSLLTRWRFWAPLPPSRDGGARALTALLLLWVPLPFYAYSVAYGSVPIFIPLWWPHSWYNTRYGMEMLPRLRHLFALLAWLAARAWHEDRCPDVAPLILVGAVAARS